MRAVASRAPSTRCPMEGPTGQPVRMPTNPSATGPEGITIFMAKRSIEAVLQAALRGALVLFLTTAPLGAVWAAEVLDLRVGVHPDYTRVVFELDRPAGYKVERGNTPSELVVTLEAGSIVRNLNPTKSLIGSIKLEPTATGSKARVVLLRDGLSLKEMILASPPRIVLDVIVPKPVAARAQPVSRSVAAAGKPARAKANPKPAAKPPAPKKQASAPAAKPAKRIAAGSKPSKPVITLEASPKGAPVSAPLAKNSDSRQPRSGAAAGAAVPVSAPPKLSSKPASAWPASAPESLEADDSTSKAQQIFALVGLAAVLVAWGVVRRRRGRVPLPSRSKRETADPEVGSDESNPFAGMESPTEETLALAAASADSPSHDSASLGSPPLGSPPVDSQTVSPDDSSAALPDGSSGLANEIALAAEDDDAELALFGEMNEAHKEAAATEPQESPASHASVEPAGVDPYQAGWEAAEEAISLVRGLEEKVASLEVRLEEAIDSREGIERQMAAQNEELRVQRAAIARTQRAVRNISRPEGESRSEPGSPAVD